jgi:hypothetical protein
MAQKYRFRNSDTVGVADAESDRAFLKECFVDTGQLDLLSDCLDHRRIVLGRTGSGKTALLNELSERFSTVITIKPESLALAYITNSTILQFVNSLGVNLDTFFKLLWRHVFTVEIIKAHFHLDSPNAKDGLIDWLRGVFSDKRRQHEKALAYLERWGSRFWEQTDYRIQELTTKFVSELEASIGLDVPLSKIKLSGGEALSQEEKASVIQRARYVVNQVQIQELSYVLDLLDSILEDPKKHYYVVIDRLDEDWIDEKLRYQLIRALIETVRDFGKVQNAKIIIALRHDLIDRVIRLSRGPGFQEEKYESLCLDLNWTSDELIRILDTRINKLVRQSYTKELVTHNDLLPEFINKCPTVEYMLERTLMRPRDVIMFFNACIRQARGNPIISPLMLKEAEGEYSRQRLRSLADEWIADYPDLMDFVDILKNRPSTFSVSDITDDQCFDLAVRLLEGSRKREGELGDILHQINVNPTDVGPFRNWLVTSFYRVSLVGLKLEAFETVVWSTSGRRSISEAEIDPKTRVSIHPMFWRSLGINPQAACSDASGD